MRSGGAAQTCSAAPPALPAEVPPAEGGPGPRPRERSRASCAAGGCPMAGRPSPHAHPLPGSLLLQSSAAGTAGSGPGSTTDLGVGAAERRGAVAVAGWGGSYPGALRPPPSLGPRNAQSAAGTGQFPAPWSPASRRICADTYCICNNVFLPRPGKDRPGRLLGRLLFHT